MQVLLPHWHTCLLRCLGSRRKKSEVKGRKGPEVTCLLSSEALGKLYVHPIMRRAQKGEKMEGGMDREREREGQTIKKVWKQREKDNNKGVERGK